MNMTNEEMRVVEAAGASQEKVALEEVYICCEHVGFKDDSGNFYNLRRELKGTIDDRQHVMVNGLRVVDVLSLSA